MEENKSVKKAIIVLIILLILVVIALIYVFLDKNTQNNYNEKSNYSVNNNEEEKKTSTYDLTTNKGLIKSYGYEPDVLISYFLDSIEKYAASECILKSVEGDPDADKLTEAEAKSNREQYKTKLENILENKEIIVEIFKKDNKVYCAYNIEKMLNSLDIGSYMGVGLGVKDFNGVKLYEFGGSNEIDTLTTKTPQEILGKSLATSSDIIGAFGYKTEEFSDYFIDLVEQYAKSGYLTVGVYSSNKSALTESQAKANKAEYKTKIENMLQSLTLVDIRVYFENSKLHVKYNVENLLYILDLEMTTSNQIKVDSDGMQIYTFK